MRTFGNPSLLVLLTSAIASCGGLGTVLQSTDGGGDGQAPGEAGTSGNDANAGDADGGCIVPTTSNFYDHPFSSACGKAGACPAGTYEIPSAYTDYACGSDPSIVLCATPFCGEADAATDARADADASNSGCEAGLVSDGDGGCQPVTVRRPFLVGSSMRSAAAVASDEWSRGTPKLASILDPATAERLARTWLKDALEEHASIAAFARFTMHLLSLGAPPDLVARSQRASLDEIRHARICFAFAQRYGKSAYGPAPLAVHDAMEEMSLEAIAALAAEEGCVGETLGAALAAEQLSIASDPEVIRALTQIATDEARHAELAWRFVAWAIARGGARVARVVAERVQNAIAATLAMEIQSYDDVDLDQWHAHGRLTCREARAVAERAAREVVRPCLQAALRLASPRATRETSARLGDDVEA